MQETNLQSKLKGNQIRIDFTKWLIYFSHFFFSKRSFRKNIRIEIREVFWPIGIEIKFGIWLNYLIHTIDEEEDSNPIPQTQNAI